MAPYGLQVAMLDFSGLTADLKTADKKDLPSKPSLIQIARNLPCFFSNVGCPTSRVVVTGNLQAAHKRWMKDNGAKDEVAEASAEESQEEEEEEEEVAEENTDE